MDYKEAKKKKKKITRGRKVLTCIKDGSKKREREDEERRLFPWETFSVSGHNSDVSSLGGGGGGGGEYLKKWRMVLGGAFM